jgi:DNA invertase Pin-like site-specific DNA recombinase
MNQFDGFRNCKNCLIRYKGYGGQKYCSDECKKKYHNKKMNDIDELIMELVKKGANSHEEIAEILKISVKTVKKIIPFDVVDVQKWYQDVLKLQKIRQKKEDYRMKIIQDNLNNPTLPKGF